MRFRPLLVLFLLAMIIPELITGSTNLLAFFSPALIFLIIGYGLPILVIREFVVKYNLSYLGIFILGIAFGIFNEGLGAKTMIISQKLPVDSFDAYGILFGISFPWSLWIAVWHAVASVLIPILLMHYLYPQVRSTQLIGAKTSVFLFLITILLGSVLFFTPLDNGVVLRSAGTLSQYLILVGCMFICVLVSLFFKHADKNWKSSAKPFFIGVSLLFTYFVALTLLAKLKVHIVVFYALFIFLIIGHAWLLRNADSNGIILFGLGMYFQNLLIALVIFIFAANLIQVFALLVAMIAVILFSRRIIHNVSMKRQGVQL
jgi:hypothetical protein